VYWEFCQTVPVTVGVFFIAKEATKRKIERVIRREFSIEIRKKEDEIELINQVF